MTQEISQGLDYNIYCHWTSNAQYNSWVFNKDVANFHENNILAWGAEKGDGNGQWPMRIHLPACDSKIAHGVASSTRPVSYTVPDPPSSSNVGINLCVKCIALQWVIMCADPVMIQTQHDFADELVAGLEHQLETKEQQLVSLETQLEAKEQQLEASQQQVAAEGQGAHEA